MAEAFADTTRRSPFPPKVERFSGVEIAPLPPRTRLSLRLRPADAARIGSVAGLALDIPITSGASAEGRRIARLGPDEWLVVADAEAGGDLAQSLEAALAGMVHAVVDVGHGRCGVAIEGPLAAAALNAGCPLDLALSAFPVGTTTRTVLGKIEILLVRTGERRFEVETGRSYADYLRGFLVEAAHGV